MESPVYVRESLKRIDSKLRIRWSYEKKSFAIDRKCDYRNLIPKPVKYKKSENGRVKEVVCPEHSERYISYHDGYLPLLYTRKPDERLIYQLHRSDSFRLGKRFVNAVEDAEEKRQQAVERQGMNEMDDRTGEMYDRLKWANGERMAVGG